MRILRDNSITIILVCLIILLYFAFRLPNLTTQPVFVDEAIYIRWAQIMKSEPTLRFLPLSDGKTPLFMWIMMPVFKIIEDPLVAGRLLAVVSGVGTLLGSFVLGLLFFNKRTALFGAFLVAITPYIIFFDRIALVDTLLSAFTIWAVILTLLLVRFPRLDLAMFLGFILGGGLLTKTPGMFNVLMTPIAGLTFNFYGKGRVSRILKVFGLFLLAIAIAMGIYNILRLGPGFTSLNSRNQDYVRNPMDLLNNPFDPFIPHFWDLTEWWIFLLGYPLIIATLLGVYFGIYKKNKYLITILLMALGPMIVQLALLKTFTARYLLFSLPPLLVVAGFGLDNLLSYAKRYKNSAILFVTLILLIWPVYFTSKLLFDIENTPLPKNERRGYLEDWTAGYGLREIAAYLDNESKKGLIIVGTEGSFGTLPDGLQIYFDKNRNVVFKPGHATVSAELRTEAEKLPTFYVANEARLAEFPQRAELIKRIPKARPADNQYKPDAMVLYKVNP